jgi:predicted molibdopterin-dependent oxidoreductase YjgC
VRYTHYSTRKSLCRDFYSTQGIFSEIRKAMMGEKKEILTDCTLCYHSCGCKVTVVDGKAVKVEGLKSHPLNTGRLCPKGEAMLENIYDPLRKRGTSICKLVKPAPIMILIPLKVSLPED